MDPPPAEGWLQQATEAVANFEPASGEGWEYRRKENEVLIKDKLSQDLSLFYTVDDVQNLFRWK